MAEGLLRNLLPEKFQGTVAVSSAGTDALHGNWATDHAIKIMQEYDIDISAHRARLLNRQMIAGADLILAMEQYHLKVIRSLKSFTSSKSSLLSTFDRSRTSFDRSRTSFDRSNAHYDVPDPIGGDLNLYRDSAQLIHGCLAGVYAYLEEKHEI
jgi:protein-tyrosine phosphatase